MENEGPFFPDYHEHDDFGPAMMALSHFLIQWNWAEHNFNVLLWQFTGDMHIGAMYTAGMGNQSRSDTLLALARRMEGDKEILSLIEFAAKAFGRIKDNRNSLVHAHTISFHEEDFEKPRWTRGSKNPKNLHIYCEADTNDVIENLNAACLLARLLGDLIIYYLKSVSLSPDAKPFTLPKALVPIPVDTGADQRED